MCLGRLGSFLRYLSPCPNRLCSPPPCALRSSLEGYFPGSRPGARGAQPEPRSRARWGGRVFSRHLPGGCSGGPHCSTRVVLASLGVILTSAGAPSCASGASGAANGAARRGNTDTAAAAFGVPRSPSSPRANAARSAGSKRKSPSTRCAVALGAFEKVSQPPTASARPYARSSLTADPHRIQQEPP